MTQSEVLNAASRAESATRTPESAYGMAIHQALESEIEAVGFETAGSAPRGFRI